jgi:peptide/nickel transport system permease protein
VIGYIVRRLIGAVPTLFFSSLLIYAILVAAPGGPEARFAQNPHMTTAAIDAFRARWGLDQPIPIQYCRWLGVCNPKGSGLGIFMSDRGVPSFLPTAIGGGDNGILHGDFGYSATNGQQVSTIIGQAVGPTAILAGTAIVVWILVALLTGVLAAVKRYGKADTVITIFNYVGFSFPTFWLGLLLIIVFAADLQILPAGGMWDARKTPPFGTPEYGTYFGAHPLAALGDLISHLILPVITLVVVNIAGDSRFVRSAMIDILNQDFVRTARAKGVAERSIVFRHALRNALLPVVTNIALELPFLFTGAIVTETIFSWPGMGRQFIGAVEAFDYPVLMGILVIAAVVVVAANLLADILYAIVDPRISYG